LAFFALTEEENVANAMSFSKLQQHGGFCILRHKRGKPLRFSTLIHFQGKSILNRYFLLSRAGRKKKHPST